VGYARGVIWEPFAMALVLGLLVSAGLYFAYLWPQVEPDDDELPATEPAKPDEPAGPSAKEQG
jgi:hypothetical protein